MNAVSFRRKHEFLANYLSACGLATRQFPIGFKDEMNRFFEILARFVQRPSLCIRTRQFLHVPDPPVSLVIEYCGECFHKIPP